MYFLKFFKWNVIFIKKKVHKYIGFCLEKIKWEGMIKDCLFYLKEEYNIK